MTQASWYRKIWNKRSKGLSSVVGTVFLALAIFAISTNVFMWSLSQNAEYTQTVKEENQNDVDRLNENLVASGGNYSVLGDEVTIETTVTNAGPIAAQIINLWVFDTAVKKYANKSLDLNLNPGQVLSLRGVAAITVSIPGANMSHTYVAWFVTARGNTVPIETDSGVVLAQLAKGIGSISMDFPKFRYYEVQGGNRLGSEHYDFNVPAKENVVFGVYLTNLDESHRDINLTQYSCFWLSVPGKNAMVHWEIAKVVNGTIMPFDFKILEYGVPTLVYFGPNSASQLGGYPAAANILLYGTIGDADYGQNIPFISVYLSG